MNSLHGMNMGMPMGKKPTHRGRKPSGKPGAQHLSALTAAHGKGDFKAAQHAALNYANAAVKHLKGQAQMEPGMADVTPVQQVSVNQPSTMPAKPAGPSMARMAMLKRK